MKIYNTNSRSIEEITSRSDNRLTMYSCGPTVYDSLSVGNWTAYIRWDVLARCLRHEGYDLDWYINITDVGHLVSDGDTGEDKLEKGAKREGKTAWQVAEKYTSEFLDGLDALDISIDRRHLTKATDHIEEQIKLIKKLEAKGFTYTVDDGVYFDSSKFKDYGKMARLDLKGLKAGARIDIGQKKHATDFALWKFSPKNEKRDMEWDSPWGKGFPGWHIECSAMSMAYLGETIDIHTGGIDHIPVHHTNEIAQSEAATDQPFVRYWVHSNFMLVDGTKMSKSLNNIYSLSDIAKRNYDPMDFKVFVLQSSFQNEANFTFDGLESAKVRHRQLTAFADLAFQASPDGTSIKSYLKQARTEIASALSDNLNTPEVLSVLSELTHRVSARLLGNEVDDLKQFIKFLDEVLGLRLSERQDISKDQKQLIEERLKAKQTSNWQKADEIRNTLKQQGIEARDTPNGTVWSRL